MNTTITEPPGKPRSFIRRSLPWFIMAHFGHHLLTALPNPLLPAIRTAFNLSYTQASFITLSFALAGGAGQLPSGWFADRISPAILIAIGTLGVAIGGILVGVSQTYVMLLVFLVLMGLMTGGYHPASTPLILASVEPEKRGRALGLHLVGGNSSFFVSPLIAGPILAVWGWQGPFLTMAIPTAIFGLIFYIYLTRHGGLAHVQTARKRTAEDKPPQPGYKRRLIAYLTMVVLGGGTAMSINSFLALYMTDGLGVSDATAASLMSISFLPGVFGAPILGGWISDRIGSTKVVIATAILTGLIIYALKSASLGFGFYAVLFFMGLNMAIRMPVTEVFIMGQTPGKYRSTIYGIYYFTMQYTGAIFAPIMGGIIDRLKTSYDAHAAFGIVYTYVSIIVTVIAVITAFFIWDAKDPGRQ